MIYGQVARIGEVRLWREMNSMEDFHDCICASIYWFKMVAMKLHWSFVFGFALPSRSNKIYTGGEDETEDLRYLLFSRSLSDYRNGYYVP